MPTAQIITIIHKTGLNIVESEVLVLPVHSRETRLVLFETRLISFLSRRMIFIFIIYGGFSLYAVVTSLYAVTYSLYSVPSPLYVVHVVL